MRNLWYDKKNTFTNCSNCEIGATRLDEFELHRRNWKYLYAFFHAVIPPLFGMTFEQIEADGPILLVPNHVCAWDPLLVAMSLKNKQVYFVASEHLFRLGPATKVLEKLVAPIPRRKASSGADTAKAMLRHLKHGRSVCVFAEGAQTFDGRTQPIFPATAKLAKRSGATLVTYKIEGGYLSCPRWASTLRRGAVHGRPVGIYPPEQLSAMSNGEIEQIIERDIQEDAFRRQKVWPHRYLGVKLAEHLERTVYLCPKCGRVDTMVSKWNRFQCLCGFEVKYTTMGTFLPEKPFADLAQWEDWQKERLRNREFPHGKALFFDPRVRLTKVSVTHEETPVGYGAMELYEDKLVCAGMDFPIDEISNMSVTRTRLLMLTFRGEYYEICADKNANVRKYYEIWAQKHGR